MVVEGSCDNGRHDRGHDWGNILGKHLDYPKYTQGQLSSLVGGSSK